MQEANVYGYWEEMTSFLRNLFHATFKTNKYCIDAELMRISGSDAIIVMDNEVWYCIDGLPNRN